MAHKTIGFYENVYEFLGLLLSYLLDCLHSRLEEGSSSLRPQRRDLHKLEQFILHLPVDLLINPHEKDRKVGPAEAFTEG